MKTICEQQRVYDMMVMIQNIINDQATVVNMICGDGDFNSLMNEIENVKNAAWDAWPDAGHV